MTGWKIWGSSSPPAQEVWLELVVKELIGLQGVEGSHAQVTVRWLGNQRSSLERVSTTRKIVQFDGRVIWWEGFRRQCKLHAVDFQTFKPWFAEIEIRVFGSIVARTRVDIARCPSDGVERDVGISIKYRLGAYEAESSLIVSMRLFPRELRESQSILPALSRGLSLRSTSSSSSLRSSSSSGSDSQPSLWRAFSLSGAKSLMRFGDMVFPEVDENTRGRFSALSSVSEQWVERTATSRDGRMELQTEMFFANVDQRSDSVSGESACSVIATIIADWLHRNPDDLPLGRQFEDLIRDGASEWRRLCKDAKYREIFSDFHFDLDTVIDTKLRPIKLVTEKSFVGLFSKPDEGEEFMSFDIIWEQIISSEAEKERVYVVGWNDHFFVLKLERETIYVIDSLGMRLCEGFQQAYILKFDESSRVYVKEGERRELVSSGFRSCKEYLKGFLAGMPLREVEMETERGPTWEDRRNRLLQFEFHYTSPM